MPLVFHLGNSQVSVYRTIGPTLCFFLCVFFSFHFSSKDLAYDRFCYNHDCEFIQHAIVVVSNGQPFYLYNDLTLATLLAN